MPLGSAGHKKLLKQEKKVSGRQAREAKPSTLGPFRRKSGTAAAAAANPPPSRQRQRLTLYLLPHLRQRFFLEGGPFTPEAKNHDFLLLTLEAENLSPDRPRPRSVRRRERTMTTLTGAPSCFCPTQGTSGGNLRGRSGDELGPSKPINFFCRLNAFAIKTSGY